MGAEGEAPRSDCCDGSCGGGGSCDLEGECEDCRSGQRGWSWLASTVDLQREAYGFEWKGDEPPGEVAASLKENVLAAFAELGEVLREFHWKYWSHAEPFVNREQVIDEVVDVKHFLANMLIAVGCDDEEFEAAYKQKQLVNRQRQRDKYVASQGKESR
jgi:hypothetical protein